MLKTILFLTLIYVCIGVGSSIERNLSQRRLHSEHHAINQRSLHGKGSSKTPKSKSSKSPKSKGGKGGKGGKGSSKAPKSSKASKSSKGGKGTKVSSSKSPKSSKTPKSSKSPKSTKCHGGKGGKGGKGLRGTDCNDNAPSPAPNGGNGKPTVGCTENLRSIVEATFGSIGSGTYQEEALVWLQSDVKDNAVNCDDSAYITQRYALATLYFSTGGRTWITTNGWVGRGDECDSWFGVICDDNNQVTKLALRKYMCMTLFFQKNLATTV